MDDLPRPWLGGVSCGALSYLGIMTTVKKHDERPLHPPCIPGIVRLWCRVHTRNMRTFDVAVVMPKQFQIPNNLQPRNMEALQLLEKADEARARRLQQAH